MKVKQSRGNITFENLIEEILIIILINNNAVKHVNFKDIILRILKILKNKKKILIFPPRKKNIHNMSMLCKHLHTYTTHIYL